MIDTVDTVDSVDTVDTVNTVEWAEGVEGAEEDEGDAIFILLDGYDDTMGIGYMALWGFRAKCGTGVDG